MPFTISHAAAALPVHALSKGRLPLAALMVGSLSPDFAYFLPGDTDRFMTHSLPGMFQFCLPWSLCLWLCFVILVERPTIAFLPDAWRIRITPSARLSVRSLLLASLAIALGAATHIAWDAFTHSSTPLVEALPGLKEELFEIGGITVRVYFLLQLLSSVFGLAVLAWWTFGIRNKPVVAASLVVPELSPPVTNFERVLLVLFIGAVAVAAALLNVWRYWLHLGGMPLGAALFEFLIGGMTGAAAGWTLAALAIRGRSRLERMPASR